MRIALIHSPFVGATTWTPVAAALRGLGHGIAQPVCGPWDGEPYYQRLARGIASQLGAEDDTPLILVGHSGAGALLPSVAEAVGGHVYGAIFVDAILPHPARGWFETAPPALAAHLLSRAANGFLPRWDRWFPQDVLVRLLPDAVQRAAFVAELPAAPVAYADEAAPTCPSWPPARCGYLQLSDGYAGEAQAASAAGWLLRRDIIHHLASLTHADRVAASLHAMIAALTDSP